MASMYSKSQIYGRGIAQFFQFTFVVLLFVLSTIAHAQVSKKAQKFFDAADYAIGLNDFQTAKVNLELALNAEPDFEKAHLYLANVLFKMNAYDEAISAYKKVMTFEKYPARIQLNLAKSYFEIGDFEQCISTLDVFLKNEKLSDKTRSSAKLLRTNAEFGIESKERAIDFQPINLGIAINSEFNEYMPALSADEAHLFYTRKAQGQEDLFESNNVDGTWKPSDLMEEDVISTGHNEGAHCISADGNVLLYTICNERNTLGSCDIYLSKRVGNGWTLPKNIGKPINSFSWEAQPSISADGQSIYFVSNRAGGFGGKDIWVSHFKEGRWQTPENLGAGVNTAGDEQTPFIHFDNQTLYFSSDGRPGLGKQDIYFSRRTQNGQFASSENLGYPINTSANESGLNISLDGKTAYYAAERKEGFGGLDIYQFETPEHALPKQVTYVKATVRNAETKAVINADIKISTLVGVVYPIKKRTSDGSFLICLNVGNAYSLQVTEPGFVMNSLHFEPKASNDRKAIVLDIDLEPIKHGASMVLENVFFESNSFELLETSTAELDELVLMMQQQPNIRIEISGHTDNVGTSEYNLNLSQQRAQSVAKYLFNKGIANHRIVSKGFGDTKPITENDTDAGRSQNRRTEFKILE